MADESANGSSKCDDQLVENPQRVRADDELMMVGAVVLRDASRMLEFVERRLVEADRECLHGPARLPRHERDDER